MANLTVILAATAVFAGTVNLPQTGQTACYDSSGNVITCTGTGQDGEIGAGGAWPTSRFTVGTGAEADCVTDNLTGLMWAKNGNLPGSERTWTEALDYVMSINSNSGAGLCGHYDWRLPNINEMESLVNAQEANSATWLNGQGFVDVKPYIYWSSTSYNRYTNEAWLVNMYYGNTDMIDKAIPAYVWMVRSGEQAL